MRVTQDNAKDVDLPVWVAVQHSAFGYNNDPTFLRGLETRSIDRRKQLDTALKHGAVVFDDYIEAEDYCDAEMYPDESTALVPRARGTFIPHYKVDMLMIYVPPLA